MKKNRMIIMIFLVLGIILNENIVTFAKDADCHPKRPSVPCSAVSV